MASTYYNSAGKEVVDGDVAYASDLNDINTAVNTAFEQVETAIATVSSNQSYFADLAEKWATEAEDVAVEPGKYSAYHWAQKADDDAIATAADRVQTGLDRTAAAGSASAASGSATNASNSAIAASGSASTALGHANTAAGHATNASNSAIAAAASAAIFPTISAADEGKYLKVDTPYTGGVITGTLDLSTYAPLNSPTFTGVPAAPTASAGTNTTQVATTAFVLANGQELPEIISGGRPEGNIYGLDATTSGQILTITAGSCLDSTGLTRMKLTSSDTWTVASTNNLEQYIFIVRLVADGSFDVKGYSTFAGPSSDALVDKWRFISWAKNNGSGVLMPYRQVGSDLEWNDTSNRLVLTSSITASFVSYDISAVMPYSLFSEITLTPASNLNVHFSLDGSTDIQPLSSLPTTIASRGSVYIKYNTSTSAIHFRASKLRR